MRQTMVCIPLLPFLEVVVVVVVVVVVEPVVTTTMPILMDLFMAAAALNLDMGTDLVDSIVHTTFVVNDTSLHYVILLLYRALTTTLSCVSLDVILVIRMQYLPWLSILATL